jgi:hypothetical protein
MVQLAGVGFRDFEDLGDLAVAVAERLPEHEHGALVGSEPLHQRKQRDRHRIP